MLYDNVEGGVETGSCKIHKCAIEITLKVMSDENSVKLSAPMEVIGWGSTVKSLRGIYDI